MLVMFFFLSPGFLRRPSTYRRETLPHDRKLVRLDKFSPKIRGGHSPQNNGGPKTCKISGDFVPLLTLIANISGNGTRYRKSERHVISSDSFRVQPKRSGELWSTAYREFRVSLNPLKCTFLADYISARRGCCALKFLHALQIDPG